MVERTRSSIVRIETYSGTGTGFIFETISETALRQSALVLTNYHVVEDTSDIKVQVNNSRIYSGRVIGYDIIRDLAVLEICCDRFQALTLKDSSGVKSGNEVVAIGYALGYSGSATVTRGIVSAVRWNPDHQSWVIQTDAPINPGNSGGPLLLATGEVVGINTFRDIRDNAQGLGFAISQRTLQGVLPDLKRGIRIASSTPTSAPTPTPTPNLTGSRWRTYTNGAYDYTLSVPRGWQIDDRDKSAVEFDRRDKYAGFGIFAYECPVDSIEDFVETSIDYRIGFYKTTFQLIEKAIFNNHDGAGAYLVYRAQINPDNCVQLNREVFLVADSSTYVLQLWICEHSLDEYVDVGTAMLDSFTLN